MEPPAGAAQAVARPSATSRLRLLGYAAVLTALPFSQSTGRMVADTKIDLVLAPWRFLAQATRMWDPVAAFGQIQNQADGYLWPMGPFFALGHALDLPAWVTQRLWWAVLLNLAFFGIVALCRELRVGRPWTQVAAAAAYVLAPRATTLVGVTSAELWPTALAPWVLLVLVRGSSRGSVMRAGAAAGLLVACCGGVNATAVAAVLPPGLIWLLTRPRGPRRWRLLGWWALFTGLSCLWWLVPLVLQGRYSSPFLDYIETASVTGSVTDLGRSLLGVSDWVAYASPGQYPAGAALVTTPFLVLDAAAISALGLAGLASRRHPQQRFAVLALVVGLALVGLGYAGQLHGWDAVGRQHLLDGVLSALRNTHKFDLMVRLALSLGVAHALTIALERARDATHPDLRRLADRVLVAATAVALVGLAFPWLNGEVAAPGGFDAVPTYWTRVASYLQASSHGGIALEVPAAPFGDYTWGDTQDDVLQPLARSPWAVRNVVPLAEPGNVDLLDEVTELIESGQPSDDVAAVLAVAGVSELVVRNDLDRYVTGAPDPAYLHATLDSIPGLTRVAGFGPWVGSPRVTTDAHGVRTVADGGLAGRYRSVEVYRIAPAMPGDALLEGAGNSIAASPGNVAPLTLAGDLPSGTKTDLILTDGLRRQDEAFQAVRQSRSATLPAGSAPQRPGPEQSHRVFPDQERWQTVETWRGIAGVTASSSQAYANAAPPILPATAPGSAVDGSSTGWHSAAAQAPGGQWLRVGFLRPTAVPTVTLSVPEGAADVGTMTIVAGSVTRTVRAPAPGATRTYRVDAVAARSLRITSGPSAATGWWGIAGLAVPGVHARRVLALPAPPARATVTAIELHRDAGSTTCPTVGGVTTCNPAWGTAGDDGDTIARSFTLPAAASYVLRGRGSVSADPRISTELAAAAGVGLTVTGSDATATADSPAAMIDGSLGTSWDASRGATIHLTLPAAERLTSLTLAVGRADPVAAPERVRVRAGGHRLTGRLDPHGTIALPGWRARHVAITILSARRAYSTVFGVRVPLGVGVSELEIDGKVPGTRRVEGRCGDGPSIDVNGHAVRTRASGSLAQVLRGREVELLPCRSAEVDLPADGSTVIARPGRLFVPDELDLGRPVGDDSFTGIPVRRDGYEEPVSARMPAEQHATVLALPQNFDAGWRAVLDGRTLTPRRVDGWQQGWVVPAGLTGTVRFSFPPQRWWWFGLWAGLGGAALTLAVLLFARRNRLPEQSADAAPAGLLDAVVLAVAFGLLAGWIGLGIGVLLGLVTARIRPALGLLAAAATLLAALPLMFPSLGSGPAIADWRQCWAVVACAAVGWGALTGLRGANGPRFFSRSSGASRNR